MADRAQNRAVDRHTRFNIGSVSKMFAAVAILLLVDDGKVELDAPVVRYVPEFTMEDARYRRITLRMLLNHSSGLPGSTFFFQFEPDAFAHRRLLETLKGSRLKHDPGAMSIYCNDGFTLAGIVVERVAGRPFLDFLADRVWAPLGMGHTRASVGESGGDDVAEFYEPTSGKKSPREVVAVYAAGGLSSTAEDVCRFGDSFLPGGKRLLSEASLREILRPQPTPFADKLRGPPFLGQLGWDYARRIGDPATGTIVLAKGGNTGFYSANLQILPSERVVIALIASGRASGDKLTAPILKTLLGERTQLATEGEPARPPESRPIPAALARYAGHYAAENGAWKASFDRSRRTLVVAPLGGKTPALTLTYHDGYFYPPTDDSRYYFGTAGGIDFIAANVRGITGYHMVVAQKLPAIRQPRRLRAPMQDESWLIRNLPASVAIGEGFPTPIVISQSHEALPGYVDFGGVRRIERADLATMAATAVRDQTDLTLVAGQGGPWVRTAYVLRSSARSAPRLPTGAASVTIGDDGLNEWRAVGTGAVLGFTLPAKGRVLLVTRDAVLYDSRVDGAEVYAPAGSYVFFAGVAGDTFHVRAR